MCEPVLQRRDPSKPLPKASKRSRRLNPGWDQLAPRYRFHAEAPMGLGGQGTDLSPWRRVSIQRWHGEDRVRWAFKTRSARDKFLHAFKAYGVVKA